MHRILAFLSLATGVFAAEKTLPFWDLARLDAWNNIELVQTTPEQVNAGTYTDPQFPEASMVFPSVWRDGASGQWRMIYSIKWSPFTIMAAQSEDGIVWKPLPVPDAQPEGGKLAPHHIFTFAHGQGSGVYRDPVASDGFPFKMFGRQDPDAVYEQALADPKHPWHDIAQREGKKRYMSTAATLVSKDGLHWRLKKDGNWATDDWSPEPPVFCFHRESDHTHVLTARPGWGDRRLVLRETRDFTTWSEPQLHLQPDTLDVDGPVGFYGMNVLRSGPGYVGVLWTFRNSSSVPVNSYNQFFGDFDSQLAFSYDGHIFTRGQRKPFIALNAIPQHGCAQIRPSTLVTTGGEVRIYSESHKGAHGRERSAQKATKEPTSAVLLHRVRRDGFMHLRSRGDFARIQTKPMLLKSAALALNVAADFGEVRWQITDVKSKPIDGLSFEDCVPLRNSNAMHHVIAWKSTTLDALVGKVVRLEIEFRQANLFAIYGDWHFIDAQDLWLIEDGKSVPAKRFDNP
ncbi:MAG: hypothetical protein K1X78_03870 [Verrucomicrobiaceae bacterium]|nr:hypothetical protein [Verrucomicrobiaceae bacterium]